MCVFIFIWPICIHNSLFGLVPLIRVPFVIDNSLTGAHKMLSILICLPFASAKSNDLLAEPLCYYFFIFLRVKIIQNYCLAIQSVFTSDNSKSTTLSNDHERLWIIIACVFGCVQNCKRIGYLVKLCIKWNAH